MSVFISWSGERSKAIAELLDDWLQCVLQTIDPWISTQDISKGTLWNNEINNQLKGINTGIICLTRENKNSPWILFETGALAKGISSNRVCTFLIDLQPQDISDPLAQFNHTFPTKDDMFKLLITLNDGLEKPLREKILKGVFETYWGQFEQKFSKILQQTQEQASEIPETSDKDILTEILSSVRNVEKRVRFLESRDDIEIKKINNVDKMSFLKKTNERRSIINGSRPYLSPEDMRRMSLEEDKDNILNIKIK